MTEFRIGVIGCGGIATSRHLPYLVSQPGRIKVTALVDANPAALEAAGEKFGVQRRATHWNEILDHVDAVVVCLPTNRHVDATVAALEAGKHVLCEKPMARTLEQAQPMARAAERSGKILQIAFVRRFDDEWLAFADAVRAGKIGRPVVWRDVTGGPGPWQTRWYFRDEDSGGPFMDGCIHNIDFALHLFGPVEWVFTHGRTMNPENTAIDTGTATLRFVSGDELMLAWSWGLPVGASVSRVFDLLGPEGAITWPKDEQPGDPQKRFVINRGRDGGQEVVRVPSDALARGYEKQIDAFVHAATGGLPSPVPPDVAVESLRVAEAVLHSARTNEVVRL